VALRIDVVERLSEALRHPHGAQQVHTLTQELRLESGVRTRVLRELGGQSGGAPMKRRRRRRGGKSPATAADKKGGVQGEGRSPIGGAGRRL
jgi:ATP-dependent RNA helicase SUPV3L1/SUV3